MTDYDQEGNSVQPARDLSGAIAWCHVMYSLHALSAAGGLGSATVVGAFVFGWPSIIAVIINYITRDKVRGTWLDSHWRWQLRTFWFAVLWGLVALLVTALLIATIVGILVFWLPMAMVGIWIAYRVIRGWLALVDRRDLPLPPS